ncbi:prepilin-type N-terminal cleavage/methylation domain-containing protein [bacterium]|nr:prepilin-type N-terminal cleavage/methylation domain-containing protein [bacterium]
MPASRTANGFTLLELVLALALSTAFLSAFLISYRTLVGTLSLATADMSDADQAVALMNRITRELDSATGSIQVSAQRLSFKLNNVDITYEVDGTRLVSGGQALGPVLANLDASKGPFYDFNGSQVATAAVFSVSPPSSTDSVQIQFVTQRSVDAPKRYIRGIGTPRSIRPN